MAGADAFGEDKKAYEDYLDTIENVEEEKEKKKGGLLGRFKFWGKKKRKSVWGRSRPGS